MWNIIGFDLGNCPEGAVEVSYCLPHLGAMTIHVHSLPDHNCILISPPHQTKADSILNIRLPSNIVHSLLVVLLSVQPMMWHKDSEPAELPFQALFGKRDAMVFEMSSYLSCGPCVVHQAHCATLLLNLSSINAFLGRSKPDSSSSYPHTGKVTKIYFAVADLCILFEHRQDMVCSFCR